MVKKVSKNLICIFLLITFVFSLTGCSLQNNVENKTIEDKTNEEISYLEDEILTIANKYAKGEYDAKQGEGEKTNEEENQTEDNKAEDDKTEEPKQLNWDDISKSTIKINDSLDTIILDLTEIEISNDDLVNFRNHVNNLNIAATNKDERMLLEEISILYSLLPTYEEKYSNNKNKINIMKFKSLVLASFIYTNLLDWDNAKNTIVSAENKYKEMMDDVDYMKEYSHNLNKIYILLEEFKTAVDSEQLELAKIKYIEFIENI